MTLANLEKKETEQKYKKKLAQSIKWHTDWNCVSCLVISWLIKHSL